MNTQVASGKPDEREEIVICDWLTTVGKPNPDTLWRIWQRVLEFEEEVANGLGTDERKKADALLWMEDEA